MSKQRIRALEAELSETNHKAKLLRPCSILFRTNIDSNSQKAFKCAIAPKDTILINISQACRFVGISRQAYYKDNQTESVNVQQYETVTQLVRYEWMIKPRVGTRRLHYLLKDALVAIERESLCLSIKKVQELVILNYWEFE